MKEFESILAKARKLAALAQDKTASPGERDNAQRMLEAHIARHGITQESLAENVKQLRGLFVVAPHHHSKPGLNDGLRVIGSNLFWYVVGDVKRDVWFRSVSLPDDMKPRNPPTAGKKTHTRVWFLSAECTALEHEDWVACFYHYAPLFLEAQAELKRKMAQIRRATRKLPGVFLNEFGAIAPNAPRASGLPSEGDLLASMLASRSVPDGDTWQRPSGRLTDETRLLA